MKYIVYELKQPAPFSITMDPYYVRSVLKNDKELKDYLFKHQDNLKNIEIFNKSNKCKINFQVIIGG